MSDLHGLSLLIDSHISEHEKVKESLSFAVKWIDAKHRDGGRITAREYQEVLNELSKIEKAVESMKEPKEILLMCVCGEVSKADDTDAIEGKTCRACPRIGCFSLVCVDCRGTEDLGGQPCHCVHD